MLCMANKSILIKLTMDSKQMWDRWNKNSTEGLEWYAS